MTKCDFCTKSHEGKCFWNFQPEREADCKEAIELMIKIQSEREADCKEAIELMIKTLSNINIILVKGENNYG